MRGGPLPLYISVFRCSGLILWGTELPGQEESLSVVEAPPKAVEPLDEQEEDLLAVDEPAEPEENLPAVDARPRVVVVPLDEQP